MHSVILRHEYDHYGMLPFSPARFFPFLRFGKAISPLSHGPLHVHLAEGTHKILLVERGLALLPFERELPSSALAPARPGLGRRRQRRAVLVVLARALLRHDVAADELLEETTDIIFVTSSKYQTNVIQGCC